MSKKSEKSEKSQQKNVKWGNNTSGEASGKKLFFP